MSDDRSQIAKRLFYEAIELGEDTRAEFLSVRCDGDEVLRAQVAQLLAADAGGSKQFLAGALGARPSPAIPSRIGRYEITRHIGDGGMGSVFEAVQDNPRRSVALKLLRGWLLSADALRRFEFETQVLASLQHPGIAQIYEAGTQLIGGEAVPFFAMELVPNAQPITEFARSGALRIPQRLSLLADVCDAVQHGHQRGVIHRDLKPSNIVVDSAGRPRVIDFGVARQAYSENAPATILTHAGQIVGTLPYMSPEQCGGDPRLLDVRSDVYSLGVVLYELLCDRLPFDVGRVDMLEAARIIREEAPGRPSAIQRVLRGDLETIVLKSLEKDRARRYQTAGDLARDIRHHLAGEPIEARRDSTFYVLRKTVQRYRAAFAALLAFVVLISVSTVVAWSLMLQARQSEQDSKSALRDSLVAQARARRQIVTAGRRSEAMAALARAAAIRPGADLRNEVISTLAVPDLLPMRLPSPPNWRAVVFSTDLSRYVICTDDGRAKILSAPQGAEIASFPPFAAGADQVARWYCDGTQFIRSNRPRNGLQSLEVWRISDQVRLLDIQDVPTLDDYDVSPDGKLLAVGRSDHAIHFYDLESGRESRRIEVDGVAGRLRFDPSGQRLARFQYARGEVSIIDLDVGTTTRVFEGIQIKFALAWSPDGKNLAAAEDDLIRVWSISGQREIAVLRGHDSQVAELAFSQDGRLLASHGWEGVCIIWDLSTLRPILRSELAHPTFGPDGSLGGIKLFNGTYCAFRCADLHGEVYRVIGGEFGTDALRGAAGALHPAGRLAAAAFADQVGQSNGVRFFDLAAGCPLGRIPCGDVAPVRFDPGGTALYGTGSNGLVQWPVRISTTTVQIGPMRALPTDFEPGEFDLSADGRRLAVVSLTEDGVTVFDLDHFTRLARFVPLPRAQFVALSPNGKWAAVTTWHGSGGEVWDVDAGAVVARPDIPGMTAPAFSPDGRWLAMREWTRVRFLKTGTWQEARRFEIGHGSRVGFSPDGRMAACTDERNALHLLDANVLQEIAVIDPPDPLTSEDTPCFTGDATLAVFTSQGALLQLWDLRAIRAALSPLGLDWEQPPLAPAAPRTTNTPLRLETGVELQKTPSAKSGPS